MILIKSMQLGMQKALPVCLGYFPLGLAFGVIAQDFGLREWEVGLMSLLLFSGSGQFIAIAMMTIGAGLLSIIVTIVLVNSRYLLFSATLSLYVKRFPTWIVAWITSGITDETFVVATTHFKKQRPDPYFWLSLNITSHLAWITSTVIGAVAGNYIPDLETLGLNFALPAMFIALFFMTAENRQMIAVGLIAGLLSLVFLLIGITDGYILLATVIAASVGVGIKRWTTN